MTLSEIENILEDLSKRHANLDKELLTTILLASGWEDKFIKDALVLFGQRKKKEQMLPSSVVSTQAVDPSVKTEITFYKTDGEEEGELKVFDDSKPVVTKSTPDAVPSPEVVSVSESVVIPEGAEVVTITTSTPSEELVENTREIKENIQPTNVAPVKEEWPLERTEEPESLIVHEEVSRPEVKTNAESSIPGNLPLLPFESSPHIWSFSKYKDVFHGEVTPPPQPASVETKQVVAAPQVTEMPLQVINAAPIPPDEEISVEKTPMTKSDESLVFLAGVMLLGIILILGYMYSNGRL